VREFFKLAAIWLDCRYNALHVEGIDKVFCFIGEMDYQAEMYLLLEEMKLGRIHKNS
jgi:hypothetical protein